ncbi:MAG: ATP-binding protein [Bacteroidota bacterium]
MKKRFLHICFLLLLTGHAVNVAWSQDFDSEKKGLDGVYALLELAENFKRSDPRLCQRYAKEAEELINDLREENILNSSNPPYDKQVLEESRVDAYILQGIAYKAQKRRQKAQGYLRDARTLAQRIRYRSGEKRANSVLKEMDAASKVNNFLNDVSSTFEKLIDGTTEEVDEVDENIKDEVAARSADLNETRAKIAEGTGDYERAIELYEKSIKYHISIGDSAKSEVLSQRIVALYAKLGEEKEAEEIIAISESERIEEESSNPNQAVKTFKDNVETILEASEPDPILNNLEAKTEESILKTYKEAETLRRAGRNRESRAKEAEAREQLAWLVKIKSERQLEDMNNQIFIEKMLSERDSFEASAESLSRDRTIFILIAFLFLSIAALSAWLFFSKRKSHQEVSKAYEELEDTHQELKSTQTQLVAAEKMASLGQLTAGIAHEINNPVNFISGNIHPLKSDVDELMRLLNAYENTIQDEGLQEKFSEIKEMKQDMDFEYLREEISELLEGMEEGAHRTTEIVKGLRMFARVDEEQPKAIDIHLGIDNTLALLKTQLKGIELIKDYGEIPIVEGFPGKINQVFMNVLTNAIQAMPEGGWIRIKTRKKGKQVEIRFQDTGSGIPRDIVDKIFEPFFTTKELGEGTGLGLSISLGILKQHGGYIDIETDPGHGTEVILSLPIQEVQMI